MRYIYEQNTDMIKWVVDRIPYMEFDFNDKFKGAVIGILDSDGNVMAGFLYYNYSEKNKSIEMAMAADDPKWATKTSIGLALGYPFIQLGCIRVTTIVARKNKRARKLVQGLGFVEEGKVRKAFIMDDGIIYGMLVKEAEAWIYNIKKAA